MLTVCPAEKLCQGSVAAVVVITKKHLVFAHCGDCKIHAYETNNKKLEILYSSRDHKPNDPLERARIEKNGGKVMMNRISTKMTPVGIAVARAFGDFQYKKLTENDDQLNLVIVEPDTHWIERNSNIPGLMICCDGVTDVMTDEQILISYSSHMNLDQGSAYLVRQAFDLISRDNISALFLTFR